MKLVTTVHGWVQNTSRTPIYYGIDRVSLRFYDQVICVSDDLHKQCLRLGVRADRCSFIHNAIDCQQFSRTLSCTDAKMSLGAPMTGLLLGAIGRLSPEKGFDLLIQAVASLVRRGCDIHLLIAGEGSARPQLEAEIAKNAMGDRVKLLGQVPDPRLLLQATDLFVLSSLREGLPNVLLEAMAMQTPVVATRIAGVPLLLRDGAIGVLVEPGSSEELTTGIERLVRDAELRRRLALLGRQRIEQEYSFERRMQRVAALYDRLFDRADALSRRPRKTA
jgi:glycosyltransferase involved in cell wall biosynthesis